MVSRRDFLKLAGMSAGAALASGCAPRLAGIAANAALPHVPASIATPLANATPGVSAATQTPLEMPAITSSKYQGRNLCFVLWDHQLARYRYRPRNTQHPVPETVPLYSGSSMRITPLWEEYWRAILSLCNPGLTETSFEHSWNSLIMSDRAFTNGTGPEGDPSHWAIHSITCGGATHEMVTGIKEKHGIRIHTLKWQDGPPPIPESVDQIDMTRHFFATTGANVRLPDGSYAVYGFPQFENTIIPLMSRDDTDFIEASRVKPVSDIQQPYHTWTSQTPTIGAGRR